MPELPEVETTRQGLAQHILDKQVQKIHIHNSQLRWPVPKELKHLLKDQTLMSIKRRAKYILLNFDAGTLIIHLGMSGKMRVLQTPLPKRDKHDHIELIFTSGEVVRYHDPRRFGAWLWTDDSVEQHPLLKHLGPEPLSDAYNSDYLFRISQTRHKAIKNLLMDNQVVVGVGNIYATESLFLSRIHPARPSNSLSQHDIERLVEHSKQVLQKAIQQGGTTLKDFSQADGKPGYFAQQLYVYGRKGEQCLLCENSIESIKIGQRASAYCPNCQPLTD